MKRASYRDAIDVIAMNDEPSIMIEDEMIGFASVLLVACIFDVTQERVARDVIRARVKEAKAKRAHDPMDIAFNDLRSR